MIAPIRSHFLVHLPWISAIVRHGGKCQPLGQPAIPIPCERVHGSNERNLFELGHKWSKLFLSFGTQDLERQFSAQVTSNARQATRLRFIGLIGLVRFRETIKEPSSPLGALLGAAPATWTSHDFMFPIHPSLPFIVNTTHIVKMANNLLFSKNA